MPSSQNSTSRVSQPQRIFSNTQLRQLLLPLVIENLLNNTVGMLDTIMISSLGEGAIAGVSLVDMLNQFIICNR